MTSPSSSGKEFSLDPGEPEGGLSTATYNFCGLHDRLQHYTLRRSSSALDKAALYNPGRLAVAACPRGSSSSRKGGCLARVIVLEPSVDTSAESELSAAVWRIPTAKPLR